MERKAREARKGSFVHGVSLRSLRALRSNVVIPVVANAVHERTCPSISSSAIESRLRARAYERDIKMMAGVREEELEPCRERHRAEDAVDAGALELRRG